MLFRNCLYVIKLERKYKQKFKNWLPLEGKVSVVCYCCSVTKLCLSLCDPMDCSTPGSPVLHHLPEFAQIHVH